MHMQNAASTKGNYVDFLTTYLSLVHVITLDDLVGTVCILFIIFFFTLNFEVLLFRPVDRDVFVRDFNR